MTYTGCLHILAHASNWHKMEVKLFNNNFLIAHTRTFYMLNYLNIFGDFHMQIVPSWGTDFM